MAGAPLISRNSRKWFQLVVATVGVVWLLSMMVALTYVHNVRWDLSPGNRFTLSDRGKKVLAGVKQPVKVMAFIRTEDPRNVYIKDLLWQVARECPSITYDIVDVNRHPALAAQYNVSSYGATVVESNGKRSDFSNPSESLLMSAILRVMQESKHIYALTGHGECGIDDTDRRAGCSLLRDALTMESYKIDKLTLLSAGEIPADAAVVLELGPKSDFLEDETAVLGRWLDRGGKMLALIDPFQAPRLVGLLGAYGIEVGANVVLDMDNRLSGGEMFSVAITDLNSDHLVSSSLKAPPLFSLAAVVAARADEKKGRRVSTLLKTGPRSWASYDPRVMDGTEVAFVAGRDINGPLPVGVESIQPAGAGAEAGVETRILAFGDSDFASNRFLDYLGNKDLAINSVNWLAREDELIGNRPQQQVAGKNQFFISQSDGESMFWAAVVVQPGLFLLVAISLFVWRRFGP